MKSERLQCIYCRETFSTSYYLTHKHEPKCKLKNASGSVLIRDIIIEMESMKAEIAQLREELEWTKKALVDKVSNQIVAGSHNNFGVNITNQINIDITTINPYGQEDLSHIIAKSFREEMIKLGKLSSIWPFIMEQIHSPEENRNVQLCNDSQDTVRILSGIENARPKWTKVPLSDFIKKEKNKAIDLCDFDVRGELQSEGSEDSEGDDPFDVIIQKMTSDYNKHHGNNYHRQYLRAIAHISTKIR